MTFSGSDLTLFRSAVAGQQVLVSSHVHPDPDAIGSALAMREMLLQLGAHPQVILESGVPSRCLILPGAREILSYAQAADHERFSLAVILDSGNRSRIGQVEDLLTPDALIFNFDHHLSNDRFGKINIVDVDFAATGELLFHLCRELGLMITPGLAENLYAGLLTDTGRFRYTNTTARCLRVASELVECGANTTRVTDAMFFDLSASDVLSMGSILSSLELFADGRISTLFCRLEQIVEDPDTVIDLAASIRGVHVAAMLSETTEGKIRVSLRSRQTVNVAAIAENFGGGGHEKAAGFRMRGTLESVRERLLPALFHALNLAVQEPTAHAI